jgi:predicted alpha/beta-hydrolase family hydrolase
MPNLKSVAVKIDVGEPGIVSGLLLTPPRPSFGYVFAHGAGAGMNHSFMETVAAELAERSVATLRYQFPYMETGGKRPDPPAIAQATVRAAVLAMQQRLPDVPLIAGGKSFGGRMTSQAQAAKPLDGVIGLAFFGFPLHPANQPSITRAEHLSEIHVPMLFLQGTRDALARQEDLETVVRRLGTRTKLFLVPDADHSFHVPKKSGKTDAQVRAEILDELVAWGNKIVSDSKA